MRTTARTGAPQEAMSAAERRIVAQSLGLFERLELYRLHPELFVAEPALAAERLGQWRRALGPDDPAALDRRLTQEGFDRASIIPALGRVELAADTVAPSWLVHLRELIADLGERDADDGLELRMHREQGILVFQHVFEAWVEAATRQVGRRVGRLWDELDQTVHRGFQAALLDDLSQGIRSCLIAEFEAMRSRHLTSNDLALAVLSPDPPRRLYAAFVNRVLNAGCEELMGKYPVAARLLGTRVGLWVDHVCSFLERLSRDRPRLQEVLLGGAEPGPLTAVNANLSDPHAGGRSVVCATFTSGLQVYYKPRPVAPEKVWNDLLGWLDGLRDGPSLGPLNVMECEEYGWMEAVEPQLPLTPAQAQLCMERCGALLALAHLLRTSDCHVDNLVLAADRPALVDLETLLVAPPQTSDSGAEEDRHEMLRRLASSVLRTGMLPDPTTDDPGAHDVSGLTGSTGGDVPPRWLHVNTDVMVLLPPPEASPVARATDNDRFPLAWAHRSALRRGFAELYRFMLAEGRQLLPGTPLYERLRRLEVRFLARPSALYARLMQRARAAECLRNGLRFSLALEPLARALLGEEIENPAPLWSIVRQEHEALLRGDLPLFTVAADGLTLSVTDPAGGRRHLPGQVLASTGWSSFERALEEMSSDDLDLQLRCVDATLSARSARGGLDRRSPRFSSPSGGGETTDKEHDVQRLIARTRLLAEELAQSALKDGRGGAHWIGLVGEAAGGWQVAPADPTLYDGQCGIALFLAAQAAIDGNDDLRRLALAALVLPRRWLSEDLRSFAQTFGPGGMSGLGGCLWSMATVARLLDEAPLLDDLRRAVSTLDQRLIAADRQWDLLAGTAGLILGLDTLRGVAGFEQVPQVMSCGARHLVGGAIQADPGLGWSGAASAPPLLGMSHGASGIALALMVAWQATAEECFRATALAALAYERAMRDDERGNWPDLRQPEAQWTATWCHGAPGIALARARLLEIEDRPDWREDLEIGLATTRATTLAGPHLCCGSAGLDEVLLEIGRRTRRPELVAEARRRAIARADGADRDGAWAGRPGLASPADLPGLMTGIAGVGYGLLRMARPELLPSVLSLDNAAPGVTGDETSARLHRTPGPSASRPA